MNKKLIINDNLNWPLLDEIDSKKILELIENNLKTYQSTIKRKKTPPKHLRPKKDKEESGGTINTEIFESGILIKQHLRLGINSVTKTLETEPNIVKFVLVCQSCVPLKLLTRHLYIMCAQFNLPAGCVKNLSKSLATFLNIKSVSAFALCDASLNKNKEKRNQQFEKASDSISFLVNDISEKVIKYLKAPENPLCSKIGISKELIENTKMLKLEEISNESEKNINEIEMPNSKSSLEFEKVEEFGSDFISFDTKKTNEYLSFDSPDFILFNDDYEQNNETMEIQIENFYNFDRNRKRKLENISKSKNKNLKNSKNYKFNRLKLINKKENNNNRKKK